MTLRVVGAGLARTGTTSLKLALEQLPGGPCYHAFEVFAHPGHIGVWQRAAEGQLPDWTEFLAGYQAAVDLPASGFWRDLAGANPGALIALSVRDNAEQWWQSVHQTVFSPERPTPPAGTMMASFAVMGGAVWNERIAACDRSDRAAMMSAYEQHNDTVRAPAPAGRLLQWRPADGWDPIARALGMPVPDSPFPHLNTREQWHVPEFGQSPPSGPGQGSVTTVRPPAAAAKMMRRARLPGDAPQRELVLARQRSTGP